MSTEPDNLEEEIDLSTLATLGQANWSGQLEYFGPDKRAIYLCKEIDEESSAIFISQVLELQEQDPESPITVFINTPGGEITSAMAMFDILKCSPCYVIGAALGNCASAGLFILAACDYRIAYPSTRFFYHEPQMSLIHIGSDSSIRRITTEYKLWLSTLKQIIGETVGAEVLNAFFHEDEFYFSSQEALDLGFIHSIVKYKTKTAPVREEE